jgi:tight adherence protein B
MSGSFAAAVGCAVLAGALLPSAPGRGLERLRAAAAMPAAARSGREVAGPGRRWPTGVVAGVVTPRTWLERACAWLLRSRTAEQTRTALVELADALSAELRAGAAPRQALWRASRDEPRFAAVAAAARSPAGDVVLALHDLANVPGGAAAADLATAWVVCEAAGGRLAAPVARLSGGWRDEEQVRREVKAQLAGPRATAVLLAGLPVLGLMMGAALGADPLALLRQPSMALIVLVPGLLLDGAGLLWTARITRRAATW